MSEAQTYDFHLIFKGLFRCVPSEDRKSLSVLLVDARSPKSSPTTGEPLRDHRAVIEFPLNCWRNSTKDHLPGFLEVNKRNKGKMGLFLLHLHDIDISLSHGSLGPSLQFIENGSTNDFRNLPQIADISPSAARVADGALQTGANCIARVLNLNWGMVGSERKSTSSLKPLQWTYLAPRGRAEIRRIKEQGGVERDQLRKELNAGARLINLDVRVSAKVPMGISVRLDPKPFPNTAVPNPPAFLLRPPAGAQEMKVWIKNRELDVILTESDQEKASEEGCTGEDIDFDFELQYNLSQDQTDRRIPYRQDTLEGDVTAGGCACGGCTG